MATSSIFTSFNIRDKKTAEAFAEALDISANEPKKSSVSPKPAHVTNREKIIELFTQRKNKDNE